MYRIAMDVADEALLRVVQRPLNLFFEQLGEADNRVQRVRSSWLMLPETRS